MEERTAVITFRIEPSLKTEFEKMAKQYDQTTSQMLRRAIRRMVGEENEEESEEKNAEAQQQTTEAKKPKKGQRLAAAGTREMHRK